MTQEDLLLTITDYGTRTSCKVEELAGYYGELMRPKLWEDLQQLQRNSNVRIDKDVVRIRD